ncbi:MAG: hypothetical protein JST12_14335 [Armatimonadetes bacterium]|nr:hypothetical protein [Armatimonadota bacterium]
MQAKMDEEDLHAEIPSWGEEIERRRIAAHEAGHAAMLVRYGQKLTSLSIDPAHRFGQHTRGDGSYEHFLQTISILTAGRTGVLLSFPDKDSVFWNRGCDMDFQVLDETIEEFWTRERLHGIENVRAAIRQLNDEATRINSNGSSQHADPTAPEAELMVLPTNAVLTNLADFVAFNLSISMLKAKGSFKALALARERVLTETTVTDVELLSNQMREAIESERN